MYLKSLNITNFRNIESIELSLSPGFNYIFGANGAGKTAILESIHLLSRGRSFRTPKSAPLVRSGCSDLFVRGSVEQASAQHAIAIGKSRSGLTQLKVDGVKEARLSSVARFLPIQTLLPNAAELVLGGPAERRAFLDWGLFHVEQTFLELSRRYRRVLSQRNAWLKTPEGQQCLNPGQDPWFEQLFGYAESLSILRHSYVKRLIPVFTDILAALAPELDCELAYDWGGLVDAEQCEKKMSESLARDVKFGVTHRGPQRGDLLFQLAGTSAGETASRGQAKSLASACLLAQAKLLETARDVKSVFLIDDFGAELDFDHGAAFVRALVELDCQVIATSTEPPGESQMRVQQFADARMFHVKHGQIAEES